MMSNSFIGSPVERVEDLRFLRGRGEYVGDVARPGMLHATIVRSSQAHGRILRVDASRALSIPGVHAVLTAEQIGPVPTIPLLLDVMPDLQRFQQSVIAGAKVRYVGEPIAVVVAESRALAEDAAEVVDVEISPLPVIATTQSRSDHPALLFDEHGTNLAGVFTAVRGDAHQAFAEAPYTRRETFRVHRHTAMPMEPRGIIADWDGAAQRMTVWGATKAVFANRRILALQLGIEPGAIRMIENDVGGAFGMRGEFHQEDFLIPFAARRLRRAVQWIEDRGEHFQASHHAREVSCDLELACRRDGAILAMRGSAVADLGAYVRTVGATPAR
ncbi:MAG TPA: molybdopterin cofactor-binding domain-containing protein, partial [Marisediminicola sp.]|nr:molybdopterin cofactor-binding domain-containing protein [Marisediminicola sp.]